MALAIGEREAGADREVFDAALTLPEMLQHFEAVRMAERLRDLGKAREDMLFWAHA